MTNQEPKTGHWVGIDEYPHEDYECDNCGFIHTFIDGHTAQYNYCPNCGAKMVEPKDKDIIWYDKRNYSEIVVEPQKNIKIERSSKYGLSGHI